MDAKPERNRDAAGIGPYARDRERLVPMGKSHDWIVSQGNVDVRGWDVRAVSGRQLGVVRDLLVDPDAGEVVLLDIDIPGTDQHSLVPIRVAQIDRAARVVLMDSSDVLPQETVIRREVVVERPMSLEGRAAIENPLPPEI